MSRYNVYAAVHGSKFLGTFEASSPEEAEAKAMKANGSVNLCHQCDAECEDAEIGEVTVERATDE